jgi:urease accessory protein
VIGGPASAAVPKAALGWRGHLRLQYTLDAAKTPASTNASTNASTTARTTARTIARDQHSGPLRVLQALYPEGDAICHHVLVHPPGGVVGGDELHIDADLAAGTHALITTPGATRFYRSDGAVALQRARLHLGEGARLEWLPLETIAHAGCRAHNQVQLNLAPTAQCMGWDVLALGLPAAQQPFVADPNGWFCQHIELPRVWLERGRVAAADTSLLTSPLGWAGHTVLATLWLAQGSAWPKAQQQALLDAARDVAAAHPLKARAGVTAPQSAVLVLRVLAPQVEPAMQLLAQVRAAWRQIVWGLHAEPPRIWRT